MLDLCLMKLPVGHMVLYPATRPHRVEPVTRGAWVLSFFWIQSMVRQDMQRTLLFDLDSSIQRLAGVTAQTPGGNPAIAQTSVQLTGVYHNLLRQWSEM